MSVVIIRVTSSKQVMKGVERNTSWDKTLQMTPAYALEIALQTAVLIATSKMDLQFNK